MMQMWQIIELFSSLWTHSLLVFSHPLGLRMAMRLALDNEIQKGMCVNSFRRKALNCHWKAPYHLFLLAMEAREAPGVGFISLGPGMARCGVEPTGQLMMDMCNMK